MGERSANQTHSLANDMAPYNLYPPVSRTTEARQTADTSHKLNNNAAGVAISCGIESIQPHRNYCYSVPATVLHAGRKMFILYLETHKLLISVCVCGEGDVH